MVFLSALLGERCVAKNFLLQSLSIHSKLIQGLAAYGAHAQGDGPIVSHTAPPSTAPHPWLPEAVTEPLHPEVGEGMVG